MFGVSVNSTDVKVQTSSGSSCQEEARDMYLSVILEMWTPSKIYQMSSEIKIPIWSKASINKRDLMKEARKPKGAAAQMKRKVEESNESFVEEMRKRCKSLSGRTGRFKKDYY